MGRKKSKQNANLPPKMLARIKAGGTYYYFNSTDKDGNRVEIPLGPILSVALERHQKLYTGKDSVKKPDQRYAKHLLGRVRTNAKARSILVSIDEQDIINMLERSNYACEVTWIPFDISKHKTFRVRPWAPSVDRIDSTKGYTKENCRVVCAAVNSAMNQYGEDLLLVIARGLMSARKRKLRTGLRTGEDE
jgi:hypothetical protein